MAIRRADDADEDEVLALDLTWSGAGLAAPCEWWTVDGDPRVGYAGAYVKGTDVHLERAYVGPEHRGRRLQRGLIRAREAWGRRQGCVRATTYTTVQNVASYRTLIRAGYVPRHAREWGGTWWIRWDKAL